MVTWPPHYRSCCDTRAVTPGVTSQGSIFMFHRHNKTLTPGNHKTGTGNILTSHNYQLSPPLLAGPSLMLGCLNAGDYLPH